MKNFVKRLLCIHDGWTQNPLYFFENTDYLKIGTNIISRPLGGVDKLRSRNNWMCPKCGKIKSLGYGIYLYGPINFNPPYYYQPKKVEYMPVSILSPSKVHLL
jgi:hypothetical protein